MTTIPSTVELPDEDSFVVPEGWQVTPMARRGAGPVSVPPAAPPLAEALAAILEADGRAVRQVIDKPYDDPAVRAASRAFTAAGQEFLDDPSTGGPFGAAAVLVATMYGAATGRFDAARTLAASCLAERGVAFAAEAAVDTVLLLTEQRRGIPAPLAGWPYAVPEATALIELVAAVRAGLAAAPPSAYVAAEAALAVRRDGALLVRAMTSALLPARTDWVDEDCAAVAATPLASGLAAYLLHAAATTAGQLDQIAVPACFPAAFEPLLAVTLADGAGAAAAPAMIAWAGAIHYYDDGSHRQVEQLIAALPSDAAFAYHLGPAAGARSLPVLRAAVARFPVRGLRLIAESGNKMLVEILLPGHLRARPELAERVLPALSEPAAAVVRTLAAATRPTPEAPADAVPALLRTPPWIGRKPVKPVVVAGLSCTDEPVVEWPPGERERVLAELDVSEWEPSYTADWPAWAAAHDAGQVSQWSVLALFLAGPEELARPRVARWVPTPSWLRDVDEWLPGLVARFGVDAYRPAVVMAGAKAGEVAGLVLPLAGPELAVLAADWLARLRSARPAAVEWFRRHPATAARALVPPALGKAGTARRQAERALLTLAGQGHAAEVRAAAESYGPKAAGAIEGLLTTDPLEVLPGRPPQPPAWLDVARLPRPELRAGAGCLPPAAVANLLTVLAMCRLDEQYAGLAVVQEACEPAGLEQFALALLTEWRAAGCPSKDSWVLDAVGLLGADAAARHLAPLIRQWPGDGGHKRAVAGLDVLAAIGTDIALMQLNGIARKVPFAGLKKQANERIARIAADLELTTEQLADRLVPDFGLDPDGRAVLDYGPRRFVVGFDQALRPTVTDEDGKPRKALPKPGATDDADTAKQAYDWFATLKKDVRGVAGDQLKRLEQAMVDRRRWSGAEFAQFVAGHPLVVHIVRRVVWAIHDADGAVAATFRVAEDRSYADVTDAPVELAADAVVGIPHPLDLGADVKPWGDVLADYEIMQPFPQLDRETYTLTDAERVATALTRFDGAKVPTGRVLGLEARGWRRGAPQDAGAQLWMERELAGGQQVAFTIEPGIAIGMVDEEPEQTVGPLRVLPAGAEPTYHDDRALPLASADPVTMSEVLRDLDRLTG